jgi:hypothetical protein
MKLRDSRYAPQEEQSKAPADFSGTLAKPLLTVEKSGRNNRGRGKNQPYSYRCAAAVLSGMLAVSTGGALRTLKTE